MNSSGKFTPRVSMAHLNVPQLINAALTLTSFLHYVHIRNIEFEEDERDMKEAFLDALEALKKEL